MAIAKPADTPLPAAAYEPVVGVKSMSWSAIVIVLTVPVVIPDD